MSENIKKIIGSRIQLARHSAGMTQAILAEKIDRTEESVSNMERGVTTPSIEKLFEIATLTERPLSFFVASIDDLAQDTARQKQIDQIDETCRSLGLPQLKIAAAQILALKG